MMNNKKNSSIQRKRTKSPQNQKIKQQSLSQRSLAKNKYPLRKSQRLIEKQKQKQKNYYKSFKTQKDAQSQQKIKKKPIQNKQKSKSKGKRPVSQSKVKNFQSRKNEQKQETQTEIQIQDQERKVKTHQLQNQKKQFMINNCLASPIQMPQIFQHQYISSTTPLASDIRNNFTHIHSHTDRTQRSHCQSASYFQYRITFQLLNSENPADEKVLQQKIIQIDNTLGQKHNILVSIQWRYLEDSEVFELRNKVEKRSGVKINKNKIKGKMQKQRKKSFDAQILRVLNSKHVPQYISYQNRQVLDKTQISKSDLKHAVHFSDKSQEVIKLYYFLWRNKQRISVGRSVSYHSERPLRQISYLKIDAHSNPKIEEKDLNAFISKQNIYIPFDFQKDHTKISKRFISQNKRDQKQSQKQKNQQQNWKIGMIQFDSEIPKRILQKIIDNQFLRSQFYVNQITVQSKRSNTQSIFGDDISLRHPINFSQLFKYVKKIQVEEVCMKTGADIFLKEIKNNLTFTKLQKLTIKDLQILQPLQFIDFQCLESIEFEGKCMHNLRSLKKFHLKSPLEKISLNKSVSLLQRMLIIRLRALPDYFQYTAGHLKSLSEINFHPQIIYENPQDKFIPIEIAARMGLKNVFKESDHFMLPLISNYNDNYINQNEIGGLVNDILGVLNRRIR